MDEPQFWGMIDAAWQAVGGKTTARQALAAGSLSEEEAMALESDLDDVIDALREHLRGLPADELVAFDRILEQKLYAIDRADIHAHIDGSDDGFLYGRGFIVAAGQGYYDAVNATPSVAIMDLECEAMCYLAVFLYEESFGPFPHSEISRETCSNAMGWPEEPEDSEESSQD